MQLEYLLHEHFGDINRNLIKLDEIATKSLIYRQDILKTLAKNRREIIIKRN